MRLLGEVIPSPFLTLMPIFNKAHFFERSRVRGIISVGRELFAGKGGRRMKKSIYRYTSALWTRK